MSAFANDSHHDSTTVGRRKFIQTTALVAGAATLFPASLVAGARANDPVLPTKYGKVRGTTQSGVHTFKGIRYGADTSSRRFRPALPPEPWKDTRPALDYGASAPQTGDATRSEDCLFLNVWTPALGDGGKRPILFYIHGGAYSNGSGSSPLTDGTHVCTRGDVVVVSVNHRLNAFGYLYLAPFGGPDYAASGNVGQLDLVMALQWVQDHAAALGGDPNNVTVFGQSGGGAKIATLMAMPAAKGLFHKAWTMSGQQVTAMGHRAATQRAERYLEALHLTPADYKTLTTLPVDALLDATKVPDFSRVEDKSLHFCPVLDSTVLPRHPFYPDATPQSAGIPMVIGNTHDETRAFLGGIPGVHELQWEQLPELITLHQFVDLKADVVIETYRQLYPDYSPTEVFFAATTAGRSWRGAVIEAEERAKQAEAMPDAAATYVYQLDWPSPIRDGKLGASHGMDIPLVFGTTAAPRSPSGDSASARQMADVMSDTLLAFAKTGDPNHAGLPTWTPYTLEKRETMVFDEHSRLENDPRGGERELYSRVPFMQRGTY
ncbi:para-nitrobenzyl esterase [Catalinimonas alkaloidigena]|uniref:Para-nitrobenzyl esterase n=1 Tax=Catalinimonas alkaloidigena TaxID=1075417 RepID=A0A1G8ZZC6_9BACT|nr:carboxylesterase/lipase family protein [Catalinimonas alkaloidigena]SDK20479.1 para-nitrobenzyl esterase [Catalinimonas alkaloidigena]